MYFSEIAVVEQPANDTCDFIFAFAKRRAWQYGRMVVGFIEYQSLRPLRNDLALNLLLELAVMLNVG